VSVIDLPGRGRSEAGESSPPFDVWRSDRIWQPLEPPSYLVDGLLVRGSLAMLAAYGASLKTWLALDLHLAVAAGEKWLGRFRVEAGRGVFVDFEAGDYEVRRRVHRLARGREYRVPLEGFAFVTMPACSLVDDVFFVALEFLARGHALICIDSLSAGSPGLDENDARFARSLYRLKAIASKTGCVILVLHHSKKGGSDDPRESLRGSSAIFNAVDVVLVMSKTKGGAFRVEQVKSRGGRSAEPWTVSVEDVGSEACVVVGRGVEVEGAAESPIEALERTKMSIIRHVREHECRTRLSVLYGATGRNETRRTAMAELIASGLLIEADGVWRIAHDLDR